MARLTRLVCLLAIAALVLCFMNIARELPAPKQNLVQEKYARWGGVLRLWACEGWQSGNGSLSAWLNAISERFERKRDGVYVQISYVSEATLRAFAYGVENPPDMILFAPGMLSSGDELVPINIDAQLRRELQGYADGLAVPLAMGGYAWAINRKLMPGGEADGALFAIPKTENYRAWSLAALYMLTGTALDAHGDAPNAQFGVDLGLPAPETTPDTRVFARRPLAAGDGSARAEDAYQRFIGGQASALAVTQREIRRLQLLSDTGRAPDWVITFTGQMYMDQLALIGVADVKRADMGERRQACVEFISYALSEDAQKLLSLSRAFQVIDAPALYANQAGMAQLEQALMENALIAPNAFGRNDINAYDTALDRVFANEIDAQTALDALSTER